MAAGSDRGSGVDDSSTQEKENVTIASNVASALLLNSKTQIWSTGTAILEQGGCVVLTVS